MCIRDSVRTQHYSWFCWDTREKFRTFCDGVTLFSELRESAATTSLWCPGHWIEYKWHIETHIRPVVSYWSETWTLIKNEQGTLRGIKRNIVRRVYGPVKEGDECRIVNNQEIQELLNHEDIVRFRKDQRIQWVDNLERMDGQRMPKKTLSAQVSEAERGVDLQ